MTNKGNNTIFWLFLSISKISSIGWFKHYWTSGYSSQKELFVSIAKSRSMHLVREKKNKTHLFKHFICWCNAEGHHVSSFSWAAFCLSLYYTIYMTRESFISYSNLSFSWTNLCTKYPRVLTLRKESTL